MGLQYYYNYAHIDPETNMCDEVISATLPPTAPGWVEIPVNDEDYCFKYYIDGNWYEDAAGTIPWQSSMI